VSNLRACGPLSYIKNEHAKQLLYALVSRVEEITTKSTYKLDVGFERCEDKGEKSAPKFVHISNYHNEEEALKPTKTHYPSNPRPSFNPKRGVKKYSKSK
jgi:hypothetical protein